MPAVRRFTSLLAAWRAVSPARRVLRWKFRSTFSAGVFLRIDFCLITAPIGHCDEPEILSYESPSVCPRGADVGEDDKIDSL